ncbi:MAG: phosphoribosylamine--glycine ligase [Candidatus Thermoplasmatota archaeon]|nr:phosphoribosylamine--glycine ligase [Candidatus Thermoplasmatota archaeon]
MATKLQEAGAAIYAAMGNKNPSILRYAKASLIVRETDWEKILDFALLNKVDIAFIGPDPVLATPLVDSLAEKGIPVASPSKDAARIETDKIFMRNLLQKHGVPGGVENKNFTSEQECKEWISTFGKGFVVKPRGLTGGKGVRVMGDHFSSWQEGLSYAIDLIKKDGSVLIEEKLVGEEFSLQAFSDGTSLTGMPLAQDYKRAYEGDTGPNTGGMGSITDHDHLLPFVNRKSRDDAFNILKQASSALRTEGFPFKGIMYGQFMLTLSGVKLIEINARFADPEGINVLSIMNDNLLDIMFEIANGNLRSRVQFMKKATVLRYIVPVGYGSQPKPGKLMIDPNNKDDTKMYYAAVNGTLSSVDMTGSRSLAIVGIGSSIPEAASKVDSAASLVHGDYYIRRDIGTEEMLARKAASFRN